MRDDAANVTLRFTTTAKELLAALDSARSATPTAPTLTAYAGVRLEVADHVLTVTGADGEIQIEALVRLDPSLAHQNGSVLVAPGPLATLLRSLPAASRVSVSFGTDLAISAEGLHTYNLRTIHATLPPPPKSAVAETAVSLVGLQLAVAAVKPASGREMAGAQLVTDGTTLSLRTTDSYRLHACAITAADLPAFQGVLPIAALSRIADINPTHLSLDAHSRVVVARSSTVRITARMLGLPFPNVERLLAQTPPHTLAVSSSSLLESLSRLQAVAENSPVAFSVKDGIATISASNVEVGAGVEELEVSGEDMEFSLARQFLTDAVNAVRSETVLISFTSPSQAVLVSAPGSTTRCVVMPVRQ